MLPAPCGRCSTRFPSPHNTLTEESNLLFIVDRSIKQATAGVTDIVAVARGAGIAKRLWVRDEKHFDELMNRSFKTSRSLLLAIRIDDKPASAKPSAIPR